MSRVRVLFLQQFSGRGGSGVMLTNILRALDRSMFEPIVLCPPGEMVRDFEQAGAHVVISSRMIRQLPHYTGLAYWFGDPRFWVNAFMFLPELPGWERIFRQFMPDIVCLDAVTLLPFAKPARRAGAKVLCLVQETLASGFLGVRRAWIRRALSSWMDGVVFISRHDMLAARCTAPVVEVIPNWVDFSRFDRAVSQTDARERLGIPEDSQVVLMMGGISRIKGTLPFVLAVACLADIPNLKAVVVGECAPERDATGLLSLARGALRRAIGRDYRRRVLAAVAAHKLHEKVVFLGVHEDVVPLYAASDVVVFPAVQAHQARPVLEAGAMAKPVVVSRFPELAEFVRDEDSALLVPPGDVRALASALRRVLSDKKLALRLGERNYCTARTWHDAAQNGPMVNKVFSNVATL